MSSSSDKSVDVPLAQDSESATEPLKSSIGLPQSRVAMERRYGKGLRLLEKLGYTGGGLGASRQGRLHPLEGRARIKQRGLQQGEASYLSSHASDADLFTPTHFRSDLELRKTKLLHMVESSEEEPTNCPTDDHRTNLLNHERPRYHILGPSSHGSEESQVLERARDTAREEIAALRRQIRLARLLREALAAVAQRVCHGDVESVAELYAAIKPLCEHEAWFLCEASQVAQLLFCEILRTQDFFRAVQANVSAVQMWRAYICSSEIERIKMDQELRRFLVPFAATFFQDWKPHDERAVLIYKALTTIFTDELAFIRERFIIPELKTHLATMTVEPANQDVNALVDVLQWVDVLPDRVLAALLCDHLLPEWLHTLKKWLTLNDVSLREVLQWYTGWRSLLPPTFVADAGVRGFLQEACKAIHRVCVV